MTAWRIIVAPLEPDEQPELIELDDAIPPDAENQAVSAVSVFANLAGISIMARADAMGGYRDERIIPWSRVIDYRKTGD